MTNPYRTLFKGTLTQISDMCSSGTEQISPIDMLPARDGANRLVIRGSTIAGAMLHTARKLGYTIPKDVGDDDEGKHPSHWITYNSYVNNTEEPLTQLRQYVKIDSATGAAEDHALFDMEVVVRGTEWTFLLEVKTDRPLSSEKSQVATPEQLAIAVLTEWQENGVFLGRRSVAGTGWMKLTHLETRQLTTEADSVWPDNSQHPSVLFNTLAEQSGVTALSKEKLIAITDKTKALRKTPTLRSHYRIRLSPGLYKPENSEECWGLDGVFIGGHPSEMPFSLDENELSPEPEDWKNHFHQPQGFTLTDEQDMPDHFFVYNEKGQPYLPGSSIRGVIYHQVRRNLTSNKDREAILTDLFGSTERSSQLYVGDAQLEDGSDWKAMVMHNHTEDEFTAGVYGSNKFVRCAVVEGQFICDIILEHQNKETLKTHQDLLQAVFELGEKRQLPIGGKQWVDSGWIQWNIETIQEAAK